MIKMKKMYRKANVILEYGIIISIIIGAMVGINHVVRRGVAGKIRAASDRFIISEGEAKRAGRDVEGPVEIEKTTKVGHRGMDITTEGWTENSIGQGAPLKDVVDYAKKPPEIIYPDAWYTTWDQKWRLVW